jgi:O-antigen/teichoic acid export membrane protein
MMDRSVAIPGQCADGHPSSLVAPVSLKRNVLWTLAGNAAYGGCQWAMLIVIAKMGTPEMVGRFALAFAITAPVMMAANLNLRGMLATDSRQVYAFGDYLSLRLISLAVAGGIVACCAALLYRNETGVTIAIVAVAKSAESISDVYFGFMQRHERMDWISRSFVIKGIASLAGVILGVHLGKSVQWATAGVALAWAAVLVFYDIPRAAALARAVGAPPLRPHWRRSVQARLGLLALPLGIAALLASLQTNLPRLFVERLLGARELGFFAAAGYLMIVCGRFMTALGESASPRLAVYHSRRDGERFTRLVLRMLATMLGIGGVAIILALVLGKPLLALLYRPEYAQQSHVLVFLMAAATMGYTAELLQYAMTASRVLRAQPAILAGSALVTALACVALVPRYGNAGAAVAMCIGSVVHMTGNLYATYTAVRRLRDAPAS